MGRRTGAEGLGKLLPAESMGGQVHAAAVKQSRDLRQLVAGWRTWPFRGWCHENSIRDEFATTPGSARNVTGIPLVTLPHLTRPGATSDCSRLSPVRTSCYPDLTLSPQLASECRPPSQGRLLLHPDSQPVRPPLFSRHDSTTGATASVWARRSAAVAARQWRHTQAAAPVWARRPPLSADMGTAPARFPEGAHPTGNSADCNSTD
jgi:hypothetical protein